MPLIYESLPLQLQEEAEGSKSHELSNLDFWEPEKWSCGTRNQQIHHGGVRRQKALTSKMNSNKWEHISDCMCVFIYTQGQSCSQPQHRHDLGPGLGRGELRCGQSQVKKGSLGLSLHHLLARLTRCWPTLTKCGKLNVSGSTFCPSRVLLSSIVRNTTSI